MIDPSHATMTSVQFSLDEFAGMRLGSKPTPEMRLKAKGFYGRGDYCLCDYYEAAPTVTLAYFHETVKNVLHIVCEGQIDPIAFTLGASRFGYITEQLKGERHQLL